jgi:hypothetical protein
MSFSESTCAEKSGVENQALTRQGPGQDRITPFFAMTRFLGLRQDNLKSTVGLVLRFEKNDLNAL